MGGFNLLATLCDVGWKSNSCCWVYKFQTNFCGLQSQSQACQQLWRDLTSVSLLCWQARSGDCILALCLRRNRRQENISTLVLSGVNGWSGSRLEICSDAGSNDCTDPTEKKSPLWDKVPDLLWSLAFLFFCWPDGWVLLYPDAGVGVAEVAGVGGAGWVWQGGVQQAAVRAAGRGAVRVVALLQTGGGW